MKRKAEFELLPYRPAPCIPRAGNPTQLVGASQCLAATLREPQPAFSSSGLLPHEPQNDGVEVSAGDDVESHNDGATENTEDAQSTPITTALSTSSRKFPSDLKTIRCTWPNCTKTFNRPARLTAHLRSHNNDRPFKCAQCSKTYMEEKHLRQHVKGSHSQERSYPCPDCGKAFLTATRLRRHAAVHEGQDRFRCRGYDDTCTRTFRKHQTLQRHIRVDHLGQPAFVCSRSKEKESGSAAAVCGARFESAGALRRHVSREHGTAKYWCEECLGSEDTSEHKPAGFATKALLEAHMRQEHVGCLFCDVRCTGPAALHRHIDMYHSGKTVADRKTVACPHAGCGKTFTRQANLNVHVRAVHEGLRYVCGDAHVLGSSSVTGDEPADPQLALWDAQAHGCGRGFVSKMKLEEHILYVHLGRERPPTVAAAMTTTAKQDSLNLLDDLAGTKRTLACTHTGCAARFVRHHDLRQHQQREHSGWETTVGEEDLLLAMPGDENIVLGDDVLEDLYGGTEDADMFDAYVDLGLSPPHDESGEQDDDAQWQVDEAEMRRLIGDSGEPSDASFLDPQLFV